jgi:serine/threonine protein kinase
MSSLLQFGAKLAGGRYTLLKSLGRGGMGEVWLAQDERLKESVALKFLSAEVRAEPLALDDLRRETARSRLLTHSGIVRIYDLHEEPGGPAFISMEYVDGGTLGALRLLQPDRVLHWEFLAPLVQQLCVGLEYAHGENVIHRDLKPANLMIDREERLKLADFGLAAAVSDAEGGASRRRAKSGTLLYMSPQQLEGQPPQPTDDIYALGATLYEMLTGKPPFYRGDIAHQILNEAPEPLLARMAELEITNPVPPEVSSTILDCLAKDPAHRPQSARAVAERLGLQTGTARFTGDLANALFDRAPADETDEEPDPPTTPRDIVRKNRVRAVIAMFGLLLFGTASMWCATRLWPGYIDHYVDLEPLANDGFEHLRHLPEGLGAVLNGDTNQAPSAIEKIVDGASWQEALKAARDTNQAKPLKARFCATRDITFQLRSAVATETHDHPRRPVSLAFEVSIHGPAFVYLLINGTYVYPNWAGQTVGEVELDFSDDSKLVYPLVAWETLRDVSQYRKSYRQIPPPRDKAVSLHRVYSSYWSAGGEATIGVIDMLTIDLPTECRSKTLTTIRLNDTSRTTVNSADPGLLLMGMTVRSLRKPSQ